MANPDTSWFVVKSAGCQRRVDVLCQFWRLGHVVVRLAQIQETGATRRNQLFAVRVLLCRQRQVASDQGIRRQRLHRHVFGGAAAIPVVNLGKIEPQRACHRHRGLMIGDRVALQRAPGIVAVFHLAPSAAHCDACSFSRSRALARIAFNWSIPLMRLGVRSMRPFCHMPSPRLALRTASSGRWRR